MSKQLYYSLFIGISLISSSIYSMEVDFNEESLTVLAKLQKLITQDKSRTKIATLTLHYETYKHVLAELKMLQTYNNEEYQEDIKTLVSLTKPIGYLC